MASRLRRARAFMDAASEVHPDDLRQLATGLLVELSAGMPSEHVFGTVREDARWWAGKASPIELSEVTQAALERLPNRAMHVEHRKRLFLALWRGCDKATRDRFLAFARGAI